MDSKQKNKILILTGIFPPDIGGPATILEALMKSLGEHGFDVKLLTYSDESESDRKDVFRVKRNQFFICRYFKYLFAAFKLAKSADVIYVTDIYSVGYFAYLLKKILGKKYIVRFAGDSAWETAVANGWTTDYIVDFQDKTYNSRIEKQKARRKRILVSADKVIAVSNFMAGLAQKIGVVNEKIEVIYNAVDFTKEKFDPKRVSEIKSQFGPKKLIATACRLTPWKGVDGIIKILPELKSKIEDVHLLVLGDGPELDNLKKLVEEKSMTENVSFLGRVKREDAFNYFKAADIFILNSNYEGLSHTLLEVMDVDTPIITTGAGGNPEVIEDGKSGLLVGYNNNKELSAAALKILTDEVFARSLAANAKEKLKNFNWSKTVEQTIGLLNEISNG